MGLCIETEDRFCPARSDGINTPLPPSAHVKVMTIPTFADSEYVLGLGSIQRNSVHYVDDQSPVIQDGLGSGFGFRLWNVLGGGGGQGF